MFFILTKNKALNNAKYVNPFRKVPQGIPQELNDQIKSFMDSVNDSVSYINNSRKMQFVPLTEKEILTLTDNYFNGFNEGFDTDILLDRSKICLLYTSDAADE